MFLSQTCLTKQSSRITSTIIIVKLSISGISDQTFLISWDILTKENILKYIIKVFCILYKCLGKDYDKEIVIPLPSKLRYYIFLENPYQTNLLRIYI